MCRLLCDRPKSVNISLNKLCQAAKLKAIIVPVRAGRGYGYIVIGYYSTIFEKKKTITILFFFWSKKVQKEVQKTTKMPPVTPLTVRDLSLVAWAKSNAEDLPEGKVKCKHCDGTYTFRTKKNGQNDWTQYASFATHSWPDKTGS